MDYKIIPTRVDIVVGDRIAGSIDKYQFPDRDSSDWKTVWNLYSFDFEQLGTFETFEEATRNIDILIKYISSDEDWLDP